MSDIDFEPPVLFPVIFVGVVVLLAVARRVGSLPLRTIPLLEELAPAPTTPLVAFVPTSGLSFAWRPEEETFKEVSSAGVDSHGHTFSSPSFALKPGGCLLKLKDSNVNGCF